LAAQNIAVSGYEIHMGISSGADRQRPFLLVDGAGEGAVSADGRVCGSYLHGLFTSNGFRQHFLQQDGVGSALDYDATVDRVLDKLAEHLAAHLDVAELQGIAGISV